MSNMKKHVQLLITFLGYITFVSSQCSSLVDLSTCLNEQEYVCEWIGDLCVHSCVGHQDKPACLSDANQQCLWNDNACAMYAHNASGQRYDALGTGYEDTIYITTKKGSQVQTGPKKRKLEGAQVDTQDQSSSEDTQDQSSSEDTQDQSSQDDKQDESQAGGAVATDSQNSIPPQTFVPVNVLDNNECQSDQNQPRSEHQAYNFSYELTIGQVENNLLQNIDINPGSSPNCPLIYAVLFDYELPDNYNIEPLLQPEQGIRKYIIKNKVFPTIVWNTGLIKQKYYSMYITNQANQNTGIIKISMINQCVVNTTLTAYSNTLVFPIGGFDSIQKIDINSYYESNKTDSFMCQYQKQVVVYDPLGAAIIQNQNVGPSLRLFVIELPNDEPGKWSMTYQALVNIETEFQINPVKTMEIIVCGQEKLDVDSDLKKNGKAIQNYISQRGEPFIGYFQLGQLRDSFSLDSSDPDASSMCNITQFVLCQDKDCKVIFSNYSIWIETYEISDPSNSAKKQNLINKTSSQSLDKDHFIPSLLEPLDSMQDQRIATRLNQEIDYSIFLGMVTQGYVFNTVPLAIQVSCGAETFTRVSNKYLPLQFQQNSGIQKIIKVEELLEEANLEGNFLTSSVQLTACPIIKVMVRKHDDNVWLASKGEPKQIKQSQYLDSSQVYISTENYFVIATNLIPSPGAFYADFLFTSQGGVQMRQGCEFEIKEGPNFGNLNKNKTISKKLLKFTILLKDESIEFDSTQKTKSLQILEVQDLQDGETLKLVLNTSEQKGSLRLISGIDGKVNLEIDQSQLKDGKSLIGIDFSTLASQVTSYKFSLEFQGKKAEAKISSEKTNSTSFESAGEILKQVNEANIVSFDIVTTSPTVTASTAEWQQSVSQEIFSDQYIEFVNKIQKQLKEKVTKSDEQQNQNDSKIKDYNSQKPQIIASKMARNGITSVQFKNKMILPYFLESGSSNRRELIERIPLSQINVQRDVLNVRLAINSDVDVKDIKYYLKIIDWTTENFQVHVNFTTPLLMSQGTEPDEIFMTVKNPYLFISQETGQPIDISSLAINALIPRQVPKGTSVLKLQNDASKAKNSLQSFVYIQLVLQLFMKGSMADLVIAYYSLQLMVYVTLYDTPIPSNSEIYFDQFRNLINLEMMKPDKLLQIINNKWSIDYFIGITQQKLSQRNQSAGVHSENIMTQLQTYIFLFVMFLFAIMILLLAMMLKRYRFFIRNKLKDILRQALFNKVIQSANLTFLKVVITFSLKYINDGIEEKDPISSTLWWISYQELIPNVMFLIYPFFVIYIIESRRSILDLKKTRDRISALYEDIHLTRNPFTIYYYPFWLIRRILFVYIPVLFIPEHPVIQIQLIIMVTLFYIMQYFGNRPHLGKHRFWNECFNEYMGLFFVLHQICFTNFVLDVSTKFLIGYSAILTIAFVLITNIAIMMLKNIRKLIIKKRKMKVQKAYEMRFRSHQWAFFLKNKQDPYFQEQVKMKEATDQKNMNSYFQSFKRQQKLKVKASPSKFYRQNEPDRSLSEIQEDSREQISMTQDDESERINELTSIDHFLGKQKIKYNLRWQKQTNVTKVQDQGNQKSSCKSNKYRTKNIQIQSKFKGPN